MLSKDVTIENGMVRQKTEDRDTRDSYAVTFRYKQGGTEKIEVGGDTETEAVKNAKKQIENGIGVAPENYTIVKVERGKYYNDKKMKDAELAQGDYEEYKGWHITKSNVPGKYMAESPKGGTIFDYSVSNLKKKIDSQTKDAAISSEDYKGKQIKKEYDGKYSVWNGNKEEFANIPTLERAKWIIDNPEEAKKIG